MICSLGELGISDSVVPKEFADGIQILPDDAVPGEEVFSYLDLDDEIIELSIPDDLKIIGYDGNAFIRHFYPELATIQQPLDEIAKFVSSA